ncbi:hypothetical protein [Burkholderia pseudomallei]|uniref:hypothetical protein n=1 Tax=Burkholderia pseudomallei TaxID=28450 RepID=UPI000B05B204|nr:hypothetical protein [Burkholderia pseudomallei]
MACLHAPSQAGLFSLMPHALQCDAARHGTARSRATPNMPGATIVDVRGLLASPVRLSLIESASCEVCPIEPIFSVTKQFKPPYHRLTACASPVSPPLDHAPPARTQTFNVFDGRFDARC